MDWFRWHHGSVNDPKFQLVAKKAGCSVAEVIAVWASLLEAASQAEERGNIGTIDFEAMDCALGLSDGRAAEIVLEMEARNLVANGLIASWEKRQVKREREDNSAGRVKAFRERQNHVTPSNATDNQETPRGDKRRGEEKKTLSTPNGVEGDSKLPPCPHEAIISLYHEVLPTCPPVREWHATRRGYLQARWREKGAEKKWQEQTEGIEFFRKFFRFVGESKFLTGKANGKDGQPPFVADLEWIIKPTNFAKIVEGKYHGSA